MHPPIRREIVIELHKDHTESSIAPESNLMICLREREADRIIVLACRNDFGCLIKDFVACTEHIRITEEESIVSS